jgi:hypothetical protein
MIVPAFTDVRIFISPPSWESATPEGADDSGSAKRYVPHMIAPAFTELRIFIVLTSFPAYYTFSRSHLQRRA